MSAVTVVQRQVDAYNDHDLARFVAQYSDTITVYRLPAPEPRLAGKAQFTEFYATQRFNAPGLRAEVLQRMVLGNKVIDHERILGLPESPFEIVVAYEVRDGLIQRMWSFSPE
jgi:hypothetical protein